MAKRGIDWPSVSDLGLVPDSVIAKRLGLNTKTVNTARRARGIAQSHKPTVEERFRSRFTEADGCWLWTGGLFPDGYGCLVVGGVCTGAHRLAWQFSRGPIPEGLCVCHHCDVRNCVRPDHLFLGTITDNNADRDAKGRQAIGAMTGSSKLTDESVAYARTMVAGGRSRRSVARELGVSHTVVIVAVNRKTWRHV